ncbi:MAG: hypothetical protein ACO3DF_01915 [Burkholderiaceae bacterium]
MKIVLRRFRRQYELLAKNVLRVVPSRDIGAHAPMPGLQMGFVLGRPVVIAEPADFLGEGVRLSASTGSPDTLSSAAPDEGEEGTLAARWVVVLQANGDCHQAVLADEVDWNHKDEA